MILSQQASPIPQTRLVQKLQSHNDERARRLSIDNITGITKRPSPPPPCVRFALLCPTKWETSSNQLAAALVSGEKSNFQYILRLLNTNVDGKQKIMYALTRIKGVGRRYSNLVCKKADVDLTKRFVLPYRQLSDVESGKKEEKN